jgi:hypothetical protein
MHSTSRSATCAVVLLACLAWSAGVRPGFGQQPPAHEGVAALLQELEDALLTGDPEGYLALMAGGADVPAAIAFATPLFRPGVTQAAVRERDRVPLPGVVEGEGLRLLVESLIARGRSGRILTWRLDLRRARDDSDRWFIAAQEQMSSLEGLYRLQLDTERQFAARDLTISSIDFSLSLPRGRVFVAETPAGVTTLVLLGKGTARFSAGPAAERRQVRIFAGSDTLEAEFSVAMVRLNPAEYADRVSAGALTAERPDTGAARQARAFFDAQVRRSFSISLGDLSSGTWSLTPTHGDFLADFRTRKHGTLTYARSSNEAEDVTLFDRARRRNISLYASPQKLESRGRFYDEDALAEIDILDYDVDVMFVPDREWVEGRTTLELRIRANSLTSFTLRLAESLVVRSVSSPQFGRLMHFRVVGQNGVVVNLPTTVLGDQRFAVTVEYSGRLAPQVLEREAIAVGQDVTDLSLIQPEPRYIYSNRTFWYPQSPVTDYATATLRVTLPEELGCVASGVLAGVRPVRIQTDRGEVRRRQFVFRAERPLRYLACVISRFVDPHTTEVLLTTPSATSAGMSASARGLASGNAERVFPVTVVANPRQESRGRGLMDRTAAILQFYSALLGDTPYPSFTLALTESSVPGGHSPAYFAVLNQPAMSAMTWRNDPVHFDSFPSFFLAHEIAHQWWGQAVGWKNYHEQWISEGFAQYFALLYARQERGDDVFLSVLRQMRRWAVAHSDQGPISLGYRLGHIKSDSRVFRAIVYNKSAVVLDMLRRLLGDAAFERGLRRFYNESLFRKAGTDDVKRAFEAESGEELDRFFEGWIFSADLPAVRIERQIVTGSGSPALRLTFEQQQPELFDLVIPLAVRYTSGPADLHEVRVRERTTEVVVPLNGQLRGVDPDPDRITLVLFK